MMFGVWRRLSSRNSPRNWLVQPPVLREDVVFVERRDEENVLDPVLNEVLETVEALGAGRELLQGNLDIGHAAILLSDRV